MKYTKGDIINITTTKEGDIIDFKMDAPLLSELFWWRSGDLRKVEGDSGEVICECDWEEYQIMEKEHIWKIEKNGVYFQNLPIKDLNENQFAQLWENTNYKFELFQALSGVTNRRKGYLESWYNKSDDVNAFFDSQIIGGSTNFTKGDCSSFLEKVDYLISDISADFFLWLGAQGTSKWEYHIVLYLYSFVNSGFGILSSDTKNLEYKFKVNAPTVDLHLRYMIEKKILLLKGDFKGDSYSVFLNFNRKD